MSVDGLLDLSNPAPLPAPARANIMPFFEMLIIKPGIRTATASGECRLEP